MSQELMQEQSIEQTTTDTPAKGVASETAEAEPSIIPDQDEPETPAE
jgi:hypothetical protein